MMEDRGSKRVMGDGSEPIRLSERMIERERVSEQVVRKEERERGKKMREYSRRE